MAGRKLGLSGVRAASVMKSYMKPAMKYLSNLPREKYTNQVHLIRKGWWLQDKVHIASAGLKEMKRYDEKISEKVSATILVPEDYDESRPVINWFHGGAYLFDEMPQHYNFLGDLCGLTGSAGVMVRYRCGPDHPFPAFCDDALESYEWLTGGRFPLSTGPLDTERMVIGGDSAGGGLCLSTAVDARDNNMPQASAMILLSPWLDISGMLNQSIRDNNAESDPLFTPHLIEMTGDIIRGGAPVTHPRLSPLYAESFSGLPPTFLNAGSAEILEGDAALLNEYLQRDGVDVSYIVGKDLPHVYPIFSNIFEEAWTEVENIASFVKKHT